MEGEAAALTESNVGGVGGLPNPVAQVGQAGVSQSGVDCPANSIGHFITKQKK